eukprot:CAMPEP_0170434304 /NCGR_PEP_ID=MMETSP0117_2-20130122/42974_1 /TAXON_ID=400756 /ORGANISM="Durinskia baltica, Strain CSIRO CS-38" /LENGTH=87 /DNA_ID=CAMNT_0010694139 /DNA_START=41 /DNA_END=301 /DNA_ORIENTATION=+
MARRASAPRAKARLASSTLPVNPENADARQMLVQGAADIRAARAAQQFLHSILQAQPPRVGLIVVNRALRALLFLGPLASVPEVHPR